MSQVKAEYIWIDGNKPTATLRSKTKILTAPIRRLEDIPLWGFDGSSTMQGPKGMTATACSALFTTPLTPSAVAIISWS